MPKRVLHPEVLSVGGGELRIERLSVSFGQRSVVDSVSLGVDPGEVVGLVGRSGAGKSSLLNGLAGLVPATGRAMVSGFDLIGLTEPELSLSRRHIGFVFQAATLFVELTVLENIVWVGRLRGLDRAESEAAAITELERLGVASLRADMAATLSGGEARRVNIARALVGPVKVLLVDEPTASLDVESSVGVCRSLRTAVNTKHVAALVVSHDPLVIEHVDRVVKLVDGRLQPEA